MEHNLDLPKLTEDRATIIKQKYFLYQFYKKFYSQFKQALKGLPPGKIIEIGSGGGFIKEIIPQAITSDIMPLKTCELQFSVEKISLKDKTVAAFLMLNVFHHFKNPEKALSEMERCLKIGGKIVMIEPNNSLWGKFFYQNFHHEQFDPLANWRAASSGPLSDANGALPWIVFQRDLRVFNQNFPNLKLVKFKPHTPLLYLLSGGFASPQLLPSFLYSTTIKLENFLKGLDSFLGMFATIEIKKIK